MRALVLEDKLKLAIRDVDDLPTQPGPGDVKIAIHTVGICGSDVHYYTHGGIGEHIVKSPMVLGHEASGTVVEVGADVTGLKVGDRVCMEPGVPDLSSRASKLGLYNVDPAVTFWATPPVHGVLTPFTIHPAAFTYKLPDNVSFEEGAMIEPFAVGMHAANRAHIAPGDVAVVTGAGPIGIMIALAALAAGCSKIIISDLSEEKLAVAARYGSIVPVNVKHRALRQVVAEHTDGWGADVIFEASGSARAYEGLFQLARPGGAVVIVGIPVDPVTFDVAGALNRELRIETVFRYANVFDRALALVASGKVDLKPLISERFKFEDSIAAFERAAAGRPADIKLQIAVGE